MPPPHHDEAHEGRDFQPGALLRLAVVFILALVVASAISAVEELVFSGLLPDLSPRPPVITAEPGVNLPPAPQLESSPAQSLQELRAHEDQVLGSYGWVDQKNGVVRIPIDRAIDLLLQRGLPVQAGSGQYRDAGSALPGVSSSGRMTEMVRP